jgi:hypothetical protein
MMRGALAGLAALCLGAASVSGQTGTIFAGEARVTGDPFVPNAAVNATLVYSEGNVFSLVPKADSETGDWGGYYCDLRKSEQVLYTSSGTNGGNCVAEWHPVCDGLHAFHLATFVPSLPFSVLPDCSLPSSHPQPQPPPQPLRLTPRSA